jgi:hypothetical protein
MHGASIGTTWDDSLDGKRFEGSRWWLDKMRMPVFLYLTFGYISYCLMSDYYNIDFLKGLTWPEFFIWAILRTIWAM